MADTFAEALPLRAGGDLGTSGNLGAIEDRGASGASGEFAQACAAATQADGPALRSAEPPQQPTMTPTAGDFATPPSNRALGYAHGAAMQAAGGLRPATSHEELLDYSQKIGAVMDRELERHGVNFWDRVRIRIREEGDPSSRIDLPPYNPPTSRSSELDVRDFVPARGAATPAAGSALRGALPDPVDRASMFNAAECVVLSARDLRERIRESIGVLARDREEPPPSETIAVLAREELPPNSEADLYSEADPYSEVDLPPHNPPTSRVSELALRDALADPFVRGIFDAAERMVSSADDLRYSITELDRNREQPPQSETIAALAGELPPEYAERDPRGLSEIPPTSQPPSRLSRFFARILHPNRNPNQRGQPPS